MKQHAPLELAVWNVRSRFNVGALFRTADAVGISHIYLCGITPHPPHSRIAKVSLGAENSVPWEGCKQIMPLLKKKRNEGFSIVSIELSKASIPYTQYKKRNIPTLLIVGSEVKGLSKNVLAASDACVYIPMHGIKESLNVAIAFAIVAYRIQFP